MMESWTNFGSTVGSDNGIGTETKAYYKITNSEQQSNIIQLRLLKPDIPLKFMIIKPTEVQKCIFFFNPKSLKKTALLPGSFPYLSRPAFDSQICPPWMLGAPWIRVKISKRRFRKPPVLSRQNSNKRSC